MNPTVCLTFDFDAVSPWLHMDGGERDSPTNRSRGLFGAEVGTPRLLEFLADRSLPATSFIPSHTVESFPEVCAGVATAHEVGHHGWTHTPPAMFESSEAERSDIKRSIESLRELTVSSPTGYRSPSLDHSKHTIDLLREFGFHYSSPGMARDFQPYRHRSGRINSDGTYIQEAPTDLIELPVSWFRDDYPHLAFSISRATRDSVALDRECRKALDWMLANVEAGVFVLTCPPQVITRDGRLQYLDSFVEHNRDRGVEFAETRTVADAVR